MELLAILFVIVALLIWRNRRRHSELKRLEERQEALEKLIEDVTSGDFRPEILSGRLRKLERAIFDLSRAVERLQQQGTVSTLETRVEAPEAREAEEQFEDQPEVATELVEPEEAIGPEPAPAGLEQQVLLA